MLGTGLTRQGGRKVGRCERNYSRSSRWSGLNWAKLAGCGEEEEKRGKRKKKDWISPLLPDPILKAAGESNQCDC